MCFYKLFDIFCFLFHAYKSQKSFEKCLRWTRKLYHLQRNTRYYLNWPQTGKPTEFITRSDKNVILPKNRYKAVWRPWSFCGTKRWQYTVLKSCCMWWCLHTQFHPSFFYLHHYAKHLQSCLNLGWSKPSKRFNSATSDKWAKIFKAYCEMLAVNLMQLKAWLTTN